MVDSSIVYEVLLRMHDDELFDYCVDITAVHYPKREAQFDIVYILYSFHNNERIRVKTQIKDGERVQSAIAIWPTANWLEREVYDMFGIGFEGHPDLKRILLPDEWRAIRCARTTRSCSRTRVGAGKSGHRERAMSTIHCLDTKRTFLDSNELVLNMGPQHPSTHGVLRVILKLDGEKVLGTECVIGYLHRGVEKIAENRTYAMFNPYVDRMDYVAAVSNGLGYCQAVEKLLNVEAPPRAQYIRVILTELYRIASHQLWLGTHALDIGAITPVFYCLPRARRNPEDIRKILRRPADDACISHRRPACTRPTKASSRTSRVLQHVPAQAR